MTDVVSFPLDQVVQFDMATATPVWWCRICGRDGTATGPQATSDAIAHLSTDHGGVADRSPLPPEEFGAACRRAQPDDLPVDLTLPGPGSDDDPRRSQ